MSRRKLTDEQMADLLSRPKPDRGGSGRRDPNSIESLSKEFGVSATFISRVRARRRRPPASA